MREIKFRAWDNNHNKMLNGVGIVGYHNQTFPDVDGMHIRPDDDRFALMQYTGLHDRNGIEVWEGDIVKRAYEFTESGKPKETIDQIIYEPNMARFRFFHDYDNGHKGYSDLYSGHKVFPWEVIGNIYENAA
jgi:uncharacterized phage protein (TIGR01671 family)